MSLELVVSRSPARPGLFINAADLELARKRIKTQPWAKACWERMRREADEWLAEDLYVPTQPAGHYHFYFCPACGGRLAPSEETPGVHICSCGKEYRGEPYESASRHQQQSRLGRIAPDLALCYQLSGDMRYACRVAEILKGYARVFPSYQLQEAGGRAFLQSLDDSVWLIGLAWAYDLILDSQILSKDDCDAIEKDLLKACADQISTYRDDNNHQTWHNSAMAAVGWCIGNEALVRRAVEDPKCGALYQIENHFLPDGAQMECCIGSYQFYALQALRWTLDAAHYHGLDLYNNPKVKKAFTAPALVAMPNGELPWINDSSDSPLSAHAALYEIAYARTGSPEIGKLLKAMCEIAARTHNAPRSQPVMLPNAYSTETWKRETREAMLFGQPLPKDGKMPDMSAILPDMGLAALRAGGNYAAIDFGPHGGWHGHYDKLSVIFYGLNRILAPDTGSSGYGLPTHWYWNKTTAAHNTVAINCSNQAETRGVLRGFVGSPGVQFVDAVCDTAYPDTHLRRMLWLTGDYMVDFFRVSSSAQETPTIDWLWHCWGEPASKLDLQPLEEPIGTTDGYQYFTNPRGYTTPTTWNMEWDLGKKAGRVRLIMLPCPDTKVILADGIGTIAAHKLSAVIARRKTDDTIFKSVIEPISGRSRIAGVEAISTLHGSGVRIKMKNNAVRCHIMADSIAVFKEVTLDEGTVSLSLNPDGNLEWLQFTGGKAVNTNGIRLRMESESSVWVVREADGYKLGVASGSGELSVQVSGREPVELDARPGAEYVIALH